MFIPVHLSLIPIPSATSLHIYIGAINAETMSLRACAAIQDFARKAEMANGDDSFEGFDDENAKGLGEVGEGLV